jgi:WD40 repeat protein
MPFFPCSVFPPILLWIYLSRNVLASCGDDGAIRLWDLQSSEYVQTLRRDRPYERLSITGIRGLNEAQKATLQALGAIEEKASYKSKDIEAFESRRKDSVDEDLI